MLFARVSDAATIKVRITTSRGHFHRAHVHNPAASTSRGTCRVAQGHLENPRPSDVFGRVHGPKHRVSENRSRCSPSATVLEAMPRCPQIAGVRDLVETRLICDGSLATTDSVCAVEVVGGVGSGLCQGCGVRGLVTTSSDSGAEVVPALGFGVGGWFGSARPHRSCVSTAHQVYRVDESRIRGMELVGIAVARGRWHHSAFRQSIVPSVARPAKERRKEWGSRYSKEEGMGRGTG